MKPGDLVRHRGNKEVYLILKTREVKGEVAYVRVTVGSIRHRDGLRLMGQGTVKEALEV